MCNRLRNSFGMLKVILKYSNMNKMMRNCWKKQSLCPGLYGMVLQTASLLIIYSLMLFLKNHNHLLKKVDKLPTPPLSLTLGFVIPLNLTQCHLPFSHLFPTRQGSTYSQNMLRWHLTCRCMLNKPAAQAAGQTLPDATPPVGKIHPFSKITLTVKQIQRFPCPSRFRISEKMSI